MHGYISTTRLLPDIPPGRGLCQVEISHRGKISEDENNISDLHDYDNLDSHPDAAAARGA